MKGSASHAPPEAGGAQSGAPASGPAIGDYLDDARVAIDLEVSSRKRLFEHLAKALSSQDEGDGPDMDTVLHTLTKREKLGCTGIGNGIALPHGRIDGLAGPLMAVARLKEAIDYDAPDGGPVWLAVGILAPTEADETHLRLLAALAERFNAPSFVEGLRLASSASELAARLKAPLPAS